MAPTNVLAAPTSFLPPLVNLRSFTPLQLALDSLRKLYWPCNTLSTLNTQSFAIRQRFLQKTGIKSTSEVGAVDSGYASAEEDFEEEEEEGGDEDELQALRSDPMEKAFAIRWLTGLIARSESLTAATTAEEDRLYTIVDEASALLSSFTASTDSNDSQKEAAFTRSFSFKLAQGDHSSGIVNVTLNDEPLSEEDHTDVGLQSWAASILLAEKICSSPAKFGLAHEPASILELGAGTGLLSIVAAKILGNVGSRIVATDYHPDVLRNLHVNVDINFPSSPSNQQPPPVSVLPLDWETPDFASLQGVIGGDGRFDTILAADVIYHPLHALWIKKCVEKLLSRPSDGKVGGTFWLAIPVRTTGRHEHIDKTVDEAFRSQVGGLNDGYFKLSIIEEESIARRLQLGRADEAGYRLFRIGWV